MLGTELFSGGPLSLHLLIPFCTHSFASPILKRPPVRQNYFVFLPQVPLHSTYFLVITSHTFPFSNQELTFILAFAIARPPPPTPKNRTKQNKTIAFLHLTCQDGARHYSWRVKNLFCFCVKGRSFQVVNVSELSFIWK